MKPDEERPGLLRSPRHVDEALRLLFESADVGAIGAVHGDPAPHGDETDDVVARHRGAATGDPHQEIVHALHDDAALRTPVAGREERSQQIIYYGKRLPPSRREPRERTAWLRDNEGWRSLQKRVTEPPAAARLPASIMAISIDEGSCGAYWQEAGDEAEVEQIVAALTAWQEQLQSGD